MQTTRPYRACRVILALVWFIIGLPAFAQDYASGHAALEIWDETARANVPLWLRTWLRVLLLTFIASVFFVRSRLEARWALGGFLGVFIVATLSQSWTDLVPFAGFIALLHIVFWSPVLVLLLARRPFLKERSMYAFWTGLLTLVIAISLVFDARDTVIYLDHVFELGVL